MRRFKPGKQKGFNLLELLAVLAIMGILAAIVLPGFSDYMRDARRNDGITFLLEIMHRQERYFTEELTYTTDLTDLGYATAAAIVSENTFYNVTASLCAGIVLARCVLLTATPVGVQTGDVTLTLDSRGQRTPVSAWP